MIAMHKRAAITIVAISAGLLITGCTARSMSHESSMGHESAMMNEAVVVGGAPMLPERTIVENAVNSEDHETLVAAVKQAGLVETLSSAGPFTVFAPTDAAFAKLPDDTVSALMQDENKGMLRAILTYHVVPGDLSAQDLMGRIREGGGEAVLTTASGDTLTAMMNGPMNIVIKDERGRVATISTYGVDQANGVIHVIDTVLLPAT